MASGTLPTPSIVMEWENVRLNGQARAARVLAVLGRQLHDLRQELRAEPELIVTFQLLDITAVRLRSFLHLSFGGVWPCRLHLLPVEPGVGYYEQKNRGAAAATHDVVIFLDSDVMPRTGWLRAMLSPFLHWRTSVLAGATSVDASSFYGRATALFWLLPPPPVPAGVQPLQAYFANNLAFRRSLFQHVPFPESDAYRGQCAAQLRLLEGMGIVVQQQTDALTLHPPPPGISGFVTRAWHAGTGVWHHLPAGGQHSLSLPFYTLQADSKLLASRIRERAPMLRASRLERTAGRVLGSLYFGLKAAGHLWAALRLRLRGRARSTSPRLPLPGPYSANPT